MTAAGAGGSLLWGRPHLVAATNWASGSWQACVRRVLRQTRLAWRPDVEAVLIAAGYTIAKRVGARGRRRGNGARVHLSARCMGGHLRCQGDPTSAPRQQELRQPGCSRTWHPTSCSGRGPCAAAMADAAGPSKQDDMDSRAYEVLEREFQEASGAQSKPACSCSPMRTAAWACCHPWRSCIGL